MTPAVDPVGNLSGAQAQAQAWVGDDADMGRLRTAVATALPAGVALLQLSDADVVELAAAALSSGTLRLGDTGPAGPLLHRMVVRPAASPAAPAPAPSAAAAPRASPAASPPPASSTFASSLDAPAMAQALREAAASGVPFCEECARAAAAAAAGAAA